MIANPPQGGALVVVGRTRDSIARNVFDPLQDPTLFGPFAAHVHYTPGAPTAKVFGRTVHVLGASDVTSEKVLRGLTCAVIYIDELTLISEAFFTQALARLSVVGARLFATTNPDGPAHWVKKQVIDRAAELGYRIFEFELPDNEHLMATNPEYVAQIMREYTGLWYKRFIQGKWVQAAGAIYEQWTEQHIIASSAIPPIDRVISLGVDYGDTHLTRGYLLGIGNHPTLPNTKALYTLNEWRPPKGITQPELAADLRTWLRQQPHDHWARPEWICVDSAAASFRNQLFHDGMAGVRNAHKNVLSGIRTVAGLLATNKLYVSDHCESLIEKIPGYIWDEKAAARGDTAPLKDNDDEVDALRYAIYTTRIDWMDIVPLRAGTPNQPGAGNDT